MEFNMGLFNNYMKPGPGIDKNAPKKKGIFLYFELYFRHFWDFIKENMLYFIFSIPMLLVMHFAVTFFDVFSISEFFSKSETAYTATILNTLYVLVVFVACGSGPASAALAYMMRCVTREQHCFLLSDFWDKFKENFLYGILIWIIDVIAFSLIIPVAVKYYYLQYTATGGLHWLIIEALLLMFSLLFTTMHMYYYQFIITFNLKFKDALKNSLIMAAAYFPINLLFLAITVIALYLLLSFVTLPFALFLMFLLLTAALRYPSEFFASRTIDKKFINNK